MYTVDSKNNTETAEQISIQSFLFMFYVQSFIQQ